MGTVRLITFGFAEPRARNREPRPPRMGQEARPEIVPSSNRRFCGAPKSRHPVTRRQEAPQNRAIQQRVGSTRPEIAPSSNGRLLDGAISGLDGGDGYWMAQIRGSSGAAITGRRDFGAPQLLGITLIARGTADAARGTQWRAPLLTVVAIVSARAPCI